MSEIFQTLMTLETLQALVLGTAGGLLIGGMPGLTATMGMALLIPFSYGMSAAPAMIMIGAVYVSAVYGGSFSAILIHTPGTPASAATAIDGYELTKRGEGLRALGVSTFASVTGGTISGLLLLLLAPQLVKVSLLFSAPEYFLIAIFGLTVVGSLAGDNMLKGLIAGAFGLLIGTIGMNIVPYARYSFGMINLSSGIQLVPAMIGLFSLSEVLVQATKTTPNIKPQHRINSELKINSPVIGGRFFPSLKDLKTILITTIRASFLGTFIGILPGAGGDIGSWIGYNDAKNRSKNKDMFGHGSIEGIAGSEAGNNAVCGGALIPALTLGIPGSGASAIILGALMVQGFSPGRDLFTKYSHMTYSILIGFLLANILMGFFGFLISKHAVKLASLPKGILLPVIMVLSVVGSFALNNNIFDVYVMIFFGVVGLYMNKFSFPTAPVVLGLILGPMAERNLLNSVQMAKSSVLTYFMSRPICWVLLALILFSLFSPLLSKKLKARKPLLNVEEAL